MSNLKWKRKIGQIWPAQSKGRKLILLYHSVGNSLWAMTKSKFQDQINWLTDYCSVVPLQTLIEAKPDNDLQVALTFDDGYQSLYDQVAPTLTTKKLNATVYLNTGWISEDINSRKKSVAALGHYPDETFLTWSEVKNLHDAGWLIGSHGVNHYNFALTKEDVTSQELSQSKKTIERQLSSDCLHFSYPFGRYSDSVKKIAKSAGYQYAVAARHGNLDMHPDLFALPRINIEKDYSLKDFQNILRGKWDYLNLIHKVKGL